MSEEKIKELARQSMLETIKTNLDSAMIFTYIKSLEDRINKAIEYIEEYQDVLKEHNGDWLNYQDGFKPYLFKILKGEVNENN